MRRAAPAAALLLGLTCLTSCSSSGAPGADGAVRPGDGSPSASRGDGASGSTSDGTAQAAPGSPDTTFTVAFAGDVHFEGRTEARLAPGSDTALGTISRTLAAADLSVLNLETAITGRGAPEPKTYTFRTSPEALRVLKASGVDVVSMANNHAADFGAPGVQDTLAAKESSPIPVVGFGRDAKEAYAPYIAEVKGVKVAVLAASQVVDLTNQKWRAGAAKPGIASALDSAALVRAVTAAKRQAPVVIVYLHWGEEGVTCPTAAQKDIARKLSAAGANAVVGTHAHTMLGAGMLGDTYVGYGFGNFLWYVTSKYSDSNQTGVTTVTFTGDGRTVGEKFTPAKIDSRGVPVPLAGSAATAARTRRDGLRTCTGLDAAPRAQG